jgi:hypothetical protein
MHLVQLLLPLPRGSGSPRAATYGTVYRALREELTSRFGGLTAYTRAPAEGAWRPEDGHTEHDDIVILEVVVDKLDRAWWRALRDRLERELAQEEVLVRAMEMERL